MDIQYHKHHSAALQRDMEYKTYGHKGRPILAFPSQNGRFWDFEGFGMVDTLRPWLETGRARLICCDGIDGETWSRQDGSPRERIELHERWFQYITDELLTAERHEPRETFIATGCSMGAFHAGNFFFRRPDLFDTVIALSGLYNSHYGFPYYDDDLTYANSPQDFLPGMPADHPWLRMYRERTIILCVGQGRWEDELLESTRAMDAIFHEKGIPAMVDYWGHDVDHDWAWWRKQLPYFMNRIMGM